MPDGLAVFTQYITFTITSLLLIGVVTVVWMRLMYSILSTTMRIAHRFGMYRPTSSQRGSTIRDSSDEAFLRFSRLLRWVSQLIPGEPIQQPRTIIIPLLLIGVPSFIGILLVMWVAPLMIFGYIVGTFDSNWSTVAAILATFLYLSAVVGGWTFIRSNRFLSEQLRLVVP